MTLTGKRGEHGVGLGFPPVVVHAYAGAGFGQCEGRGGTHPPTAAGDQGCTSREIRCYHYANVGYGVILRGAPWRIMPVLP